MRQYNGSSLVQVVAHRCSANLNQCWPIVNTLRPRQNGRLFADDIFKRIFLNENVWIPIKISLKFVPKGLINYIPALFQIMAWRRPGDKPLSETMMVWLLTHMCVTRPQWVNVFQENAHENSVCKMTNWCWPEHVNVILGLNSTVTSPWMRWRLKSPALRVLTQPFIQAQIKENIKAPCHWPLCWKFTGDRWIPAQMAGNAENVSIWWRHHVSCAPTPGRPDELLQRLGV